MSDGRRRPLLKLTTIAAALALVATIAVAARGPIAVLYHEARLRSSSSSTLEDDATYVLENGNESARERVARLYARSHGVDDRWKSIRPALMNARERAIRPLLRAAVEAPTDQARGIALSTIGAIACAGTTEPIDVVYRSSIVFVRRRGMQSMVGDAPPYCLHPWAAWLVAHGHLAPDDPLVSEIGPELSVAPRYPLPLGLQFSPTHGYVAEVEPDSIAARAHLARGDEIPDVMPDPESRELFTCLFWDDVIARARAANRGVVVIRSHEHGDTTISLPLGAERVPLGARFGGGVRVQLVLAGSAAVRAGVRENDAIRAVDGAPIDPRQGVFDLARAIAGEREVELELERAGAILRVRASVDAR